MKFLLERNRTRCSVTTGRFWLRRLKFEILTGEGKKRDLFPMSMQSIARGLDLHARVPTWRTYVHVKLLPSVHVLEQGSGSLPASVSKGHHSRFAATEFTLPISHPLYEQDVSEWWVWLGEILIDKEFLFYFLETKLSYYYLNQKYYKVSFSSRFSKFIIPLSLKYVLKEIWRRKILYLKLFLKLEY